MSAAQPAATPVAARRALWLRIGIGLAVFCAALVLLLAFFPWDLLRGPLNRYLSQKTGRHFEITRQLDVKLGRTTRVLADGIEFANPSWATDPFLVRAEGAEIEVRLLPLLRGRVELPRVELHRPQLGLQIEPDGRRTWALGRDTSERGTLPHIGALVVDDGSVHYLAAKDGADIRVDFSLDPQAPRPAVGAFPAPTAPAAKAPADGAPANPPASSRAGTPAVRDAAAILPLRFQARGTWQRESFDAAGRTGNVLALSAPLERPFPAEIAVTAAGTRLQASGTIARLSSLDGAEVRFKLQGGNLADLYQLVGVVLPATPRYAVDARLSKQGAVWQVRDIDGKFGNSDLRGQLSYERSQAVGLLKGEVSSRSLDFDDLAPVVGLPEQPRSATGAAARRQTPSPARGRPSSAPRPAAGKVLPTARLDVTRLKAMNADVRYSAARVTHARQLPLERIGVHVRLNNSVLLLDSLDLGVAGGRLLGRLRIDATTRPALAEVKLDARGLDLSKLFPAVQSTRSSFGRIHGDIDLKGRGDSVAQMLGTASGNLALLMGKGQISNILLEFAGLDGAEILKFLMRGDQNVGIRCAATAFDVERGLMTTRAFVLDTTDTVIYGSGGISLADETLNLKLHPYPKDASIFSLRSPLHLAGTFSDPQGSLDMGALAGRAGLALALGAINPLLALAATVETGPGQDADCTAALREAAGPKGPAAVNGAKAGELARSGGAAARAPAPEQRLGGPAQSRPGAHYPIGR